MVTLHINGQRISGAVTIERIGTWTVIADPTFTTDDFHFQSWQIEQLLSASARTSGPYECRFDTEGRLTVNGDGFTLNAGDRHLGRTPSLSTLAVLRAIHPGSEGYIQLRAFGGNGKPRAKFFPLPLTTAVYSEIQAFARAHADQDLYHAIATRQSDQSGGLDNCSFLHALYIEIDFKRAVLVSETWDRLHTFTLPYSIAIHSGGGLHIYWLLKEPLDLRLPDDRELAYTWLGALAHRLGGEPESTEPARVLRLPETRNLKPAYGSTAPLVTVLSNGGPSYTHNQILKALGDGDPALAAMPVVNQAPIIHGLSVDERIARAKRYLAGCPPAHEGHGGDAMTYQACCGVARGHDLGEEAALAALAEWNARCVPPWPSVELRQKVRNAIRYANGQPGERLVDYPTTEVGDAEFFAERFGDRLRFNHRQDQWLIVSPDTGVWSPDQTGAITSFAIEIARERQARALLATDSARRKTLMGWALKGESRQHISNTLAIARDLRPISDGGDGWNLSNDLIGVQNGVVDLRTGELRRAMPDERITLQTAVPYNPEARSPLWEETLQAIFPHAGLVDFLQLAFGYTITGETKCDKWFLAWGEGRNGKGTIYEAVRAALGDYALELPAETFSIDGKSYDLAKLPYRRFVTAAEAGNSLRLHHDRIKQITGGDRIRAADKHQQSFEFTPACKLWFACNKKPRTEDDSTGFWARVLLIPFTVSFAGKENADIRPALAREHASAVLTWLVQGAKRYYEVGGLGPIPAIVRDATQDYRDESDPLALFYEACCEIRDGARVPAAALFAAYQRFAEHEKYPFGARTFGEKVKGKFRSERLSSGIWYVGIGLREARRDEPENYDLS